MEAMSGAQINRCLALGLPFPPHDHPMQAIGGYRSGSQCSRDTAAAWGSPV